MCSIEMAVTKGAVSSLMVQCSSHGMNYHVCSIYDEDVVARLALRTLADDQGTFSPCIHMPLGICQ